MKVICIDASNPLHKDTIKPEDYIEEGAVYTVADEITIDDCQFYFLEERLHRWPPPAYQARRFIPLSDKEESTGMPTELADKQLS